MSGVRSLIIGGWRWSVRSAYSLSDILEIKLPVKPSDESRERDQHLCQWRMNIHEELPFDVFRSEPSEMNLVESAVWISIGLSIVIILLACSQFSPHFLAFRGPGLAQMFQSRNTDSRPRKAQLTQQKKDAPTSTIEPPLPPHKPSLGYTIPSFSTLHLLLPSLLLFRLGAILQKPIVLPALASWQGSIPVLAAERLHLILPWHLHLYSR